MPLTRTVPDLTGEKHETYWVEDDAIDRDASDIDKWLLSGDTDELHIRDDTTPTTIVWRPLRPSEWDQVQLGFSSLEAIQSAFIAAFRFGCVSIEGERFQYERKNGVSRLSLQTLDDLLRITTPLKSVKLYHAWLEAFGQKWLEDADFESETSLPLWLGGLILIRSFRARTGDK